MNSVVTRFIVGTALLIASAGVQSTLITSTTTIDNQYEIYISTSENVLGTSFGIGDNWRKTFIDTFELIDGTDYFLHIKAIDAGGRSGMLGEFSLSDSAFEFFNGTQNLLTGDSALLVSTVFGSNYVVATDYGAYGSRPWNTRGTSPWNTNIGSVLPVETARWVWSDDNSNDNLVYFRAQIFATDVSEPGTLGLFGLVLLLLRIRCRQNT